MLIIFPIIIIIGIIITDDVLKLWLTACLYNQILPMYIIFIFRATRSM